MSFTILTPPATAGVAMEQDLLHLDSSEINNLLKMLDRWFRSLADYTIQMVEAGHGIRNLHGSRKNTFYFLYDCERHIKEISVTWNKAKRTAQYYGELEGRITDENIKKYCGMNAFLHRISSQLKPIAKSFYVLAKEASDKREQRNQGDVIEQMAGNAILEKMETTLIMLN